MAADEEAPIYLAYHAATASSGWHYANRFSRAKYVPLTNFCRYTGLIWIPYSVLDRSDIDGPLVEAPSLVKVNGVYVLFFSSNCYSGSLYDTSYATATNIKGPYTKAQAPYAPLLQTGTPYPQLYSPGGLDVGPDGVNVVFHADLGTTADTRQMYVGQIAVTGNTVHFT